MLDRRPQLGEGTPFRLLLLAQAFSAAGAQIVQLLISYEAVVQLHLSPLAMGVLAATGRAPFLVFGLFAGWTADRHPKRTIMMIADAARALQIVAIAAVLRCDWASLWTLAPLNFAIFTATVLFDIAYSAYLPELVDRKDIAQKNSQLEASRTLFATAAAAFAGYSLGGLDLQWTAAACAATFVCSVLFVKGLPRSEPAPPLDRESPWRAMTSGFRSIASDFGFSVLCLFGAVWNLVAAAETTLLFLHLNNDLHLPPSQIGIVYMALNVAGVPGAYVSGMLKRWVPLRVMMTGAMLLTAFGWLVVSTSGSGHGALAATIGIGMTGFFTAVYNVMAISYRQAVTPPEYQGRVIAAIRFMMWGMVPIGALIGGAVAQSLGVRQTMTLAVVPLVLACSVLVLLRERPEVEAFAK